MQEQNLPAVPLLSIVIPSYNEQANLPHTLTVLTERLHALGVSYEILVVNDASRDKTGELAEEWAARDTHVRAFHHPQNRNIGGGFLTGLQNARGEWLTVIPADLALDPNDLEKYLNASQHADVVVGLRSDKDDYTPLRRFVSWTNITLVRVLFGMRERQFQYISMYRMELLRKIRVEFYRSAFFLAEILIKARALGYRLVEIQVSYVPRQAGRATGANPRLIVRTLRDLFRFWFRWVIRGPQRASLPDASAQAVSQPRDRVSLL